MEKELTKELAGECLSLLSKTGTGLRHAYVRLDLKNRYLFYSSLSTLEAPVAHVSHISLCTLIHIPPRVTPITILWQFSCPGN